MKPTEGRRRVVIEEIRPQVGDGRYPAKRVVGDLIEVTAAIYGDGHDYIGARLLYRHSSQRRWRYARFEPLTNDMWRAGFSADKIGMWQFTIEAWIDHFETWTRDLEKRLAAQPDPREPTQQVAPQDIPLALRIGSNLIEGAAVRANDSDALRLRLAATQLHDLADAELAFYQSTVDPELRELVARYPDLSLATKLDRKLLVWADRERACFSSWYELFPRSCSDTPGQHGTFRDVEVRLPEIAAMGFDVIYLPPIHPVGVQFRKGKNNSAITEPADVGSPWAIGNAEGGHITIQPQLGTFSDFTRLVGATRAQGMEIALDIAFQCSPDHPWVKEHPDWFTIRPDGSIQYAENPPKKYQDIYPLNFESKDWRGLWDALYGIFRFWIDRGIRIFRVDNPHTKALPFWEWCISEIRKTSPETVLLAEAFTRPHVMYALAKRGYTQGYTYFTWRTGKSELEEYFEEICNPPVSDFFRPNVWPNTPDILHEQLQDPDPTRRRAAFQQRAILAATLSANWGIYGPAFELCEGRAAKPAPGQTGSEEYLDSEKYQLRHWDRSDPISIAQLISRLNHIRRENPSLQRNERLVFHETPNPQILCYSKSTEDGSNTILVVVNLDPRNEQTAWLDLKLDKLGLPWKGSFGVEDLLAGESYTWKGQWNYVALQPWKMPGHVFRIATRAGVI